MTPAVEIAGGASRERGTAGPLLSLVLGVLFIGGSVWKNISERRLQEHDVQSIAVLRHSLDSARATLAVMKTAGDSALLSEQLRAIGLEVVATVEAVERSLADGGSSVTTVMPVSSIRSESHL